ncbi:unnamed protein product [Paramecium sonneborni]|uniref:Uncharacterized protein n=1 Tax=Paramecium sonneborni TaxID=65129 RepID=A0A8S1QYQ6_9CILI|nr:unnamed protein product [Paramecium sonneborni]
MAKQVEMNINIQYKSAPQDCWDFHRQKQSELIQDKLFA